MRKFIILSTIFFSSFRLLGQYNETFSFGFFFSANFSSPTIAWERVNSIENVQRSNGLGWGVGFMYIQILNPQLRLRLISGFDFVNSQINYENAGKTISNGVHPTLFNSSLQISYLLKKSITIIAGYAPKFILYDEDSNFQTNLSSFDHSIDIGIGMK